MALIHVYRNFSNFAKNVPLVVIAQKIVHEFATYYPLSAYPLNKWYKAVRMADWSSFADVKASMSSTDFVGNDRYVFNLGGNRYRLVAMIHFTKRTLYIRFIGTHSQYDDICKKGILDTI